MTLQALILRYGYVMLFAGAALDGDASLLTGAFLAHRGYFDMPAVIATAALATTVANQLYFWMGRTRGRAVVMGRLESGRMPGWVHRALTRHATPLLFVSRFVYGFRIAIPVACGASNMRPATFAVVDVLGAACWSLVVGLAGFGIGHLLERALDDVRRHEWLIATLMLTVTLLALAVRGRDWPGVRFLTHYRSVPAERGDTGRRSSS